MIHCVHWDVRRRVFKINGAKFKPMILRLAMLLSDHVYCVLVAGVTKNTTMHDLQSEHLISSKFPESLYAVGVTFQQGVSLNFPIDERAVIFFMESYALWCLELLSLPFLQSTRPITSQDRSQTLRFFNFPKIFT